jgi:hypothetical protein
VSRPKRGYPSLENQRVSRPKRGYPSLKNQRISRLKRHYSTTGKLIRLCHSMASDSPSEQFYIGRMDSIKNPQCEENFLAKFQLQMNGETGPLRWRSDFCKNPLLAALYVRGGAEFHQATPRG